MLAIVALVGARDSRPVALIRFWERPRLAAATTARSCDRNHMSAGGDYMLEDKGRWEIIESGDWSE